MDWKLFATTFGLVFLAELGDKTQLATLSLATTGSRLTVFAASALALVMTSALAVLAAEIIAQRVSPVLLQRAAGALFVVLGVLTLWRAGGQG